MLCCALMLILLTVPLNSSLGANSRKTGPSFDAFLRELWPDAQASGISRRTFDAAFAGLTPDPRVVAATKRQPEYITPFGPYVKSVSSMENIKLGRRKATEWSNTLDIIENKYGVPRWIILAIWGLETSYGGNKDRWDVFRSLATLAQAQYRHPYFRNELIAALNILQAGHISRDDMVGSWAGTMGQPQFMPSNFSCYAVNLSGDGWPDIWTNVPDVLASIANYLLKEGWKAGLSWGFEVALPATFAYGVSRASFKDWAALGLRRVDDEPYPANGEAILFFPSGSSGPAFLVTGNFITIKRYNNSDVYALAVAHLADRLRGLGPLRASWPSNDPQLTRDQRIELQRKLSELGYPVDDVEGHIDFSLRDAIRDIQTKLGLRPDGHPTSTLLNRLEAIHR
jgi:membrane-bound lytic murein transglycosylase B